MFEPPEMTTKFHFSPYVVYGKVSGKFSLGYDYDTQYTVELEVRCVFKGGPIPKLINITHAGKQMQSKCVGFFFVLLGFFLLLSHACDKCIYSA